ncbi:hypothetical protein DFA_05802 [Cavenderia fasciculata]|uniref:Uncharacterized protein n=1 Tax=Cavenderia fasciculata TaxID=261658 RepID=F4PMS4_CACFS|nr:uncharacterized protein DFA_05802 [Cavenderia fasciculata]EGG23668.1 hypothetical protein DFA_05802 [Cavenderia fasciculata]|eukprot:XP_004361519.1 hypothetical protein DFA_05802 [Cavenderia fasciculata]
MSDTGSSILLFILFKHMPMEVKTQTTPTVVAGDYHALWKRATQDKNKPSLSELINFDWTKDELSVNRFIDFIINLVTYNSAYADECFKMLVGAFEPYKQAIANGINVVDYKKWEMIAMKVHFLFNKIISTFPLTTPLLASTLAHRFPHRVHSVEIHHFYFKNALFVTRYCPTIALSILTSSIDTLVNIDSSISLDEIPDDEDLQFNIEENKSEGAQMAHKLDILMALMFEYLNACFGVKTAKENMFAIELNQKEGDIKNLQDEMFHNLIKAFDNSVLPTYKSKYVQYLIFYTCKLYQQKNIFPAFNYNTPLLNQTQNNINIVMQYSQQQQQQQQTPTSPQYLSPFKQPTSPKAVGANPFSTSPKLRFSSSPKSKSRFCILIHCLLASIQEYNMESHSSDTSLASSCTNILRSNSKIVLPKSIVDSNSNTISNTFDSFFPFDPYLLRNSCSNIDDLYVQWSDVTKEDDDNDLDDMESDQDESEEESDQDDGRKKSSSESESDYSDFDKDDSDSDDSDDDFDDSESIDQLTEDMMSFTPTGLSDHAKEHFRKRGLLK